MAKTTSTYWNTLDENSLSQWQAISGMDEFADEITLAIDEETGDYTRLTRFKPGADTELFGPKSHTYPEEIYVLEGSLYDAAFDKWLKKGDYASRPPGEVHGPFKTETGCVVLEISYPGQSLS